MHNLIPKPTSFLASTGGFTISPNTKILVRTEDEELVAIGNLLSEYLQQASGHEIAVADTGSHQIDENIQLILDGERSSGEEGYELSITTDSIRLAANHPAGLFYGVQTLRQFLPTHPSSDFSLSAVSIRD